MSTASTPPEFLKGAMDLAVMRVVSAGPMHGYGIAQELRRLSDDVLALSAGAIYPVLHRLERKGLLEARWETGSTKRRMKVYSCTAKGASWLEERGAQWVRFANAVERVLQQPEKRLALG